MHLEPLGDQAVMAYCENEAQATALAGAVRRARPDWCIDVVQAYLSVAVFFDGLRIDFQQAADWLAQLPIDEAHIGAVSPLHRIPCCYEFGLDFELVKEHTGLTRDEIIDRHSGTIYTVYAIGFCPGFPYLGYLPPQLAGVPRLPSPRLKVDAGSIGLTGRQTGIYTEPRPGGWNIIGQTPLQLVDVKDAYFPLRTGDRVQFERIDERIFRELRGERIV